MRRGIAWAQFGTWANSRLSRIVNWSIAPIYWPMKPILQTISEVRSRYDSVRSAYGVGLLQQLTGCAAFAMSFRESPSSYFDYRLFLKENWSQRKEYLYPDELPSLLRWLNKELGPQDAADLDDKRRFHDRALQAGLPIIPVLAEFDRGAILHKRPLLDYPACDLFLKVANWGGGEDARVWQRQPDGSYSGDLGSNLTLSELCETLRSLSLKRPLILQPRIANHPELQALSGALSTVRVVTVRHHAGRIDVALACYRMPVGSLVVDNFTAGGLASRVELNDGRLGPAVFRSQPKLFVVHPDTGAAIAGRTLPHWPAVKQLALAAHREFGALPSIGWDIAITDDGPVIVEGNSVWDPELVQMSYQEPLEATIVPACLAEYFDHLARMRGPQRSKSERWLRRRFHHPGFASFERRDC
jgi:Sugar-transfer associated ATP-grasp